LNESTTLEEGKILLLYTFSTSYLIIPHLNVSTGLVGDLHDKLHGSFGPFLAHQLVEDVQIHSGAQVINVGQEAVLAALLDELLQQTRVAEGVVEVTVTRWVPTKIWKYIYVVITDTLL